MVLFAFDEIGLHKVDTNLVDPQDNTVKVTQVRLN